MNLQNINKTEVRASQLAQASERVGSLITASTLLLTLVLEKHPFLINKTKAQSSITSFVYATSMQKQKARTGRKQERQKTDQTTRNNLK